MDDVIKTNQDFDRFQYSFTQDFQNFSFIKRFLTVVLLPLVPIYIVSKGFQMRAWKKQGGDYPPSAIKNYIVLIFVYIILQLPIYLTGIWFYLLIYLWPVTIVVAIYLYRKDFTKEKIKHGTKSSEFKVIGFRKLSLTFIALLLFTISFTLGGLLWPLTITSFIFILFPGTYKKLYFIPKRFLILSYSFFNFLNVIPGIYVAGEWFIEKESEIKVMDNPYQIIKYILSNYESFFLLNVGISALMVRILFLVRLHDKIPDAGILTTTTLSSWGFLSIFLLVPVIMAVYFVWVWVWSDAEIKVAKSKFSSGTEEGDVKIKETTLLVPVSDSVKRLFTYLFGLSPIIWVVDIATSTNVGFFENVKPGGTAGIIFLLVLAFLFTGASTIFMAIMYYRSGAHEYLVNRLRNDIKQMYIEGDDTIKVAYSGIQAVEPDTFISQSD